MIIYDKLKQKNDAGVVIGVIKPNQTLTEEQVKRFYTARFDARLFALFSKPQRFSRVSIRKANGSKIVYPYNTKAFLFGAETLDEDTVLRTLTPV